MFTTVLTKMVMGTTYLGTNIICGINSVNVFFHTQNMSRPAHHVCLPCSLTCYVSALSLYTILLSLTHSHIYTHYHTPIWTSKQHSSSTRKSLYDFKAQSPIPRKECLSILPLASTYSQGQWCRII